MLGDNKEILESFSGEKKTNYDKLKKDIHHLDNNRNPWPLTFSFSSDSFIRFVKTTKYM